MELHLGDPARSPLRVLCLGAHSDDIEIGCGGTILSLTDQRDDVHVDWVVFSATGRREEEARASGQRFLRRTSSHSITTFDFRDGFLPFDGAAVKARMEGLKELEPDVIFTHRRADRHQDHRLIAELTWNTFRQHLVLEYEVPKYEGDLGQPNVLVGLSRATLDDKVEILMDCFATQRSKAWFTPDTFRGLARLRGIECPSDHEWAEGFHGSKLLLTGSRPVGP